VQEAHREFGRHPNPGFRELVDILRTPSVNSEQYAEVLSANNEAQALVGRRISNAQMGLGAVLILDFQDTGGAVDAYLRSESAWLLAQGEVGLVGSLDDREAQAEAISALVGATVKKLELRRHLQLALVFSDQHEVVLLPSYVASPEYENWVLRLPNGVVFTAGPGPRLFRAVANEP
jgi:hypothetical protein